MKKRRLAIIGSTGSIGRQALDVVRQHRDLFEIELLTANNSVDLLARQALEFDANAAVICNEEKWEELSQKLSGSDTKVFAGMDSVCSLVAGDDIDIVLTSTVGFSGFRPTIAAIKAGKPIALANKETLVAGGELITNLSKKYNAPLLPVDSEHSAIFQCLLASSGNKLQKIHLTASGGPFREWDKDKIRFAEKKDALCHPKWNMGQKITIDSASMMNKGFEMIEARWLFYTKPEDIAIVIHPESIIHSMIEFEDGAVIAQMGHPDMREPIQFAFSFPERLPLDNRKLDFAQLGKLTFFEPDMDKFPCLRLAFEATSRGGNIPCAMNAANEAAVGAFLEEKIPFYGIPTIIEECMNRVPFVGKATLDDIFATNEDTYNMAADIIKTRKW